MAKISKYAGASDTNQPGEALVLQQAEVVPGSKPESANVASTRAVEEAELSDEEREQRADERREEKQERRDERVAAEQEEQAAKEQDAELDEDEDDDSTDGAESSEFVVGEKGPEDFTPEDNGSVVATTAPPKYNPGDYTVQEVNAYLADRAEHDDYEEYNRVLEEESATSGRNRAGIVSVHTPYDLSDEG